MTFKLNFFWPFSSEVSCQRIRMLFYYSWKFVFIIYIHISWKDSHTVTYLHCGGIKNRSLGKAFFKQCSLLHCVTFITPAETIKMFSVHLWCWRSWIPLFIESCRWDCCLANQIIFSHPPAPPLPTTQHYLIGLRYI